jgi:hypothetical protein
MVSFVKSNICHSNILGEYSVHMEGVIQIVHVAFICWFLYKDLFVLGPGLALHSPLYLQFSKDHHSSTR